MKHLAAKGTLTALLFLQTTFPTHLFAVPEGAVPPLKPTSTQTDARLGTDVRTDSIDDALLNDDLSTDTASLETSDESMAVHHALKTNLL